MRTSGPLGDRQLKGRFDVALPEGVDILDGFFGRGDVFFAGVGGGVFRVRAVGAVVPEEDLEFAGPNPVI